MLLIQRLGSNASDNYVNNFLEHIAKFPGSCDEVWIPTPWGFPPLEIHRQKADFWKKAAERFRKIGVKVSVQVSNSIGHGMYISSANCSGLIYDGSPVEKLVGYDGTVSPYCFCWRGENFRKYLLEELSYYLEMKPDCVWMDDDYRVVNHNPVKFGCFCDSCMKKFNTHYKSDFSREELVNEALHGDIKWRENLIEFLRDGMYELTYEIGTLIKKLSPGTSMGYEYCSHGAYTGYGFGYIFDAMRDSTGEIPCSRPGGGVYAYTCHDPNVFIEKAIAINWQNRMLPDYVKMKCPEIENIPFVAFGKSPAGTTFEATYYFANGNTDMSFSMEMHEREPNHWHDQEYELFKKHRKYWELMSEVNADTYQAGMQYFISDKIWKKELSENDGFEELNVEPYTGANQFIRDGFPISYDKEETSVILLHPESAKLLTKAEIEMLLNKNVVTDGETVAILAQKGFDLGVKSVRMEDSDAMMVHETFTEHPLKPLFDSMHSQSYHAKGRTGVYTIEKTSSDVEIIATYAAGNKIRAYSSDENMPYGIAEAIVTTPKGKKWAILGYSPWKGVMPHFVREHFLDMADYISGNALPARLDTIIQAALLPRRDKNGKVKCVSVVNCTVGESGEIKLKIRKPAGEDFYFMSQYNGEAKLDFEKNGDEYTVTVPSINAWSVGTVFVQ